MGGIIGPAVLLGVGAVMALVVLNLSLRVVGQGRQMVVFKLGQAKPEDVRGPGLQFVVPIIWATKMVDMREQNAEVVSSAVAKDNIPVDLELEIYWRIVDALRSVVNVADFSGALQGVATTTLRAIIGDIPAADIPFRRAEILEVLRLELDTVAQRWGGTLTRLEVSEIKLRDDVRETMAGPLPAGQIVGVKTPDEILAEIVAKSRSTSGPGT